MFRYFLLAFLLLPQFSFAAVRVTEVAWMGTKDSSSNEWVELHNDGSDAVDLTSWKLVTADGNLTIALKGVIPSGGYYLIERTDDSSVPGITADLIASFGSGLSNDGETLRILDANGAVADEVIGGSSWKNIGGSSETKDTPQWSQAGWLTAIPTPRAGTSSMEGQVNQNNTTSLTTTSTTSTTHVAASHSSSHGGKTAEEKNVRDTLRLVIKHDGNVIKDAPELFKATVFGLKDEELPRAKVIWNFGDGATAEGLEVKHSYCFPGIYPVVVRATHNDLSTEVRVRIDVLNQDLRITSAISGDEGFVRIQSASDMNLSGWTLRDGDSIFTFPLGTEVYAKTPATFANMTTGIVRHVALALHRPDGRIAAVFGDSERDSTHYVVSAARKATLAKSTPASEASTVTESTTSTATSGDWSLAAAGTARHFPQWGYWAIILGFVSAAAIIIASAKVFNPNREVEDEASKYTLVEIDSNLE